jgi:hypothetical protein
MDKARETEWHRNWGKAKADKARRRIENREAWAKSSRNANQQRGETLDALAPAIDAELVEDTKTSASLRRLRAMMADASVPLYRRLDCAELVLSYELGPGAVAGLNPDEVGADSYWFLRAVSENDDTPESLRFRSLKAIVAVENARAAIRNASEALVPKSIC